MIRQRPRRQRLRTLLLIIAWLLFPLTIFYFSPYLIVDGAAQGIVNGSFLVFAAMLLSAIFLGRAYCGWACPAAGLQEATLPVNSAPAAPWLGRIRWTVWAIWMATVVLMAVQAGGLRRVEPLLGIESGISLLTPGSYGVYVLVTGLVLGTSAIAGRRGFCHALCWMAPFLILGQRLGALLRLPRLHLRAEPAHCTGCQTCTRGCPMSLPVHTLVAAGRIESDACVLCGTCVDGCKHGSIRFAFAPRAITSASRATKATPHVAQQ